jgi:hypothetical protein
MVCHCLKLYHIFGYYLIKKDKKLKKVKKNGHKLLQMGKLSTGIFLRFKSVLEVSVYDFI